MYSIRSVTPVWEENSLYLDKVRSHHVYMIRNLCRLKGLCYVITEEWDELCPFGVVFSHVHCVFIYLLVRNPSDCGNVSQYIPKAQSPSLCVDIFSISWTTTVFDSELNSVYRLKRTLSYLTITERDVIINLVGKAWIKKIYTLPSQ